VEAAGIETEPDNPATSLKKRYISIVFNQLTSILWQLQSGKVRYGMVKITLVWESIGKARERVPHPPPSVLSISSSMINPAPIS